MTPLRVGDGQFGLKHRPDFKGLERVRRIQNSNFTGLKHRLDFKGLELINSEQRGQRNLMSETLPRC